MFRSRTWWWLLIVIALALVAVGGCGGGDGEETSAETDAQVPSVAITAPPEGAVLQAGQAVQVSVTANDDRAIARIELYVDGSLIESRIAPTGSVLTTMSEQFVWSAAMAGPHSLQARAYDMTEQMGASRIVALEVLLPGAPTAGAVNTPAPGPTNPPTADTPAPLAPTEPPATATQEPAQVVAKLNANVRSGPGTNYPVVGSLAGGQSALVTGRTVDSSWWRIDHQGTQAWIANSVVTANAQAFEVLVASIPEPPPATATPLPPTATPLPAATLGPSATPIPTTGFRADQTNLSAGQCTTLRWDFDNISAIFLTFGVGYDEEGQPGHGSRQVCPSVTTAFKARVRKSDNSEQTHEVTVGVSGGGCADPAITQFAPTTYDVEAGKAFSIFWKVDCAKSVWYIKGDGAEQAVGGHGSKIDETISGDTTFKLKVEKNNGGYVYASFTVKVK